MGFLEGNVPAQAVNINKNNIGSINKYLLI